MRKPARKVKSTPAADGAPGAKSGKPAAEAADGASAEASGAGVGETPEAAAAADGDAVEAADATADVKATEVSDSAEVTEMYQAAVDPDPAGGDTLDTLRGERDAAREQLLRLAAEFDNFRKRSAREWDDLRKRAASEVLLEMLDLSDNLERALEAAPDDPAGLRKGVELIQQKLQASLKKFGLEPLDAEGHAFDPTRHEALMMVDSDDVASQHVVQVLQKGYALHGEILRPARVTVSR